jgi:hypothetical protein
MCTLLLCWYASGCYELSYVDCVLIPFDRGFLVKVIRIGLSGISSSWFDALYVLFWIVAMRCCVAQIYPIAYWLYCILSYLHLICRLRSLSFPVDIRLLSTEHCLFCLLPDFNLEFASFTASTVVFLLTVFTLRSSLRLVFIDLSWICFYCVFVAVFGFPWIPLPCVRLYYLVSPEKIV